MGLSYLLITHDMATVSALAQDVVVLHRGRVVESGSWKRVRVDPQEEYTRTLLSAVLKIRRG